MPVRVSTLSASSKLGMDVFVPVNGKAVRFAVEGDLFEDDRAAKLKIFQFPKVLIRASEEDQYRAYIEAAMNEAETNAKLGMGDRTQAVAAGTETALQDIIEKPQDRAVYEGSVKKFERFGHFLKNVDGSFREVLRQMGTKEGDYVFHGVQTAALSMLLGDALGLTADAKRRNSLMTGCFLHDLALEQAEVPQMDHAKMDAKQMEKWKKHPMEGATLFQEKDYVDRLVLTIILQHEERPNGSGFPKGMLGKEMDPLAVVVSLVNCFDHHATRAEGDKKKALQSFMTGEMGVYDLTMMQKLQELVLKHALPA